MSIFRKIAIATFVATSLTAAVSAHAEEDPYATEAPAKSTTSLKAPKGGYLALNPPEKDGSVILIVGEGLSADTVIRDFGPSYLASTGEPLTKKVLQAVEYNKDKVIAVCHTPHDGPVYLGRNSTKVWETTCAGDPAAQDLWLVAFGTVKIPTIRVETYEMRKARLEKLEACEDAACVAGLTSNAKLKAALKAQAQGEKPKAKEGKAKEKPEPGSPVPSTSVSAQPAPSASASATSSVSVGSTTPSDSAPFVWALAIAALAAYVVLLCNALAAAIGIIYTIVKVVLGWFARSKKVENLEAEIRDLKGDYVELAKKSETAEQAVVELNGLARELNIPLTTSNGGQDTVKIPRTLASEIRSVRAKLVKGHVDEADRNRGDLMAANIAVGELTKAKAELETGLRESEGRAASLKGEVDALVKRNEGLSKAQVESDRAEADRRRYEELESELRAGRRRLMEIGKESLRKRFLLESVIARLTHAKSRSNASADQAEADQLMADVDGLMGQRGAVLDNIRSRQEEQSAIHARLTGLPEREQAFFAEIVQFRDEIANDQAATQAARLEAIRAKTEAESVVAANAEVSRQIYDRFQQVQGREASLAERERQLDEGRAHLRDTEDRVYDREVVVRSLVEEALRLAGMDSSMSLEDLRAAGGLTGIHADIAKRLRELNELAGSSARRVEELLQLGQTASAAAEAARDRSDRMTSGLEEILGGNDVAMAGALNGRVKPDGVPLDADAKLANLLADVAELKLAYEEMAARVPVALAFDEVHPDEDGEYTRTQDQLPAAVPTPPPPARTASEIMRRRIVGPKTLSGVAGSPAPVAPHPAASADRDADGASSGTELKTPGRIRPTEQVNEASLAEAERLTAHLRHFMANRREAALPVSTSTFYTLIEFLRAPIRLGDDVLDLTPWKAEGIHRQMPKIHAALARSEMWQVVYLAQKMGIEQPPPRTLAPPKRA